MQLFLWIICVKVLMYVKIIIAVSQFFKLADVTPLHEKDTKELIEN